MDEPDQSWLFLSKFTQKLHIINIITFVLWAAGILKPALSKESILKKVNWSWSDKIVIVLSVNKGSVTDLSRENESLITFIFSIAYKIK